MRTSDGKSIHHILTKYYKLISRDLNHVDKTEILCYQSSHANLKQQKHCQYSLFEGHKLEDWIIAVWVFCGKVI